MKNLKLKYKLRIIGLVLFLLVMNLGINVVSGAELGLDKPTIKNETVEFGSLKNSPDEEYLIVYVKAGDSIWSLVQENYDYISKPKYMNFSDLVDYIVELNGGSDISLGQVIKIPKTI